MINAMKASISDVFEQMFFLPIDMVETDNENTSTARNSQQTIAAGVAFNGSPSGAFVLNIPEDLASSITTDFLGIRPEELSKEQITGTVKEIINMLAGNILSAYDCQSTFNLEIPELIRAPHDSGDTKHVDTIHIGIETLDNRMTLHMRVGEFQ